MPVTPAGRLTGGSGIVEASLVDDASLEVTSSSAVESWSEGAVGLESSVATSPVAPVGVPGGRVGILGATAVEAPGVTAGGFGLPGATGVAGADADGAAPGVTPAPVLGVAVEASSDAEGVASEALLPSPAHPVAASATQTTIVRTRPKTSGTRAWPVGSVDVTTRLPMRVGCASRDARSRR